MRWPRGLGRSAGGAGTWPLGLGRRAGLQRLGAQRPRREVRGEGQGPAKEGPGSCRGLCEGAGGVDGGGGDRAPQSQAGLRGEQPHFVGKPRCPNRTWLAARGARTCVPVLGKSCAGDIIRLKSLSCAKSRGGLPTDGLSAP